MDDETRNLNALYTCKICYNLLDEATALRKCQHIFCWKCIHDKITQHVWTSCPVCYVEFGPDPLRRLSYDDPLLLSMERNIFPGQTSGEMESEQEDVETESETSYDEETDSEDFRDSEDMEGESESDD